MIVNIRPSTVRTRLGLADDDQTLSLLLFIKQEAEDKIQKHFGTTIRLVFFEDRENSLLPRQMAIVVWRVLQEAFDRLDLVSIDQV